MKSALNVEVSVRNINLEATLINGRAMIQMFSLDLTDTKMTALNLKQGKIRTMEAITQTEFVKSKQKQLL